MTDSHYRKWKRIAGTKNRFLTYSNLNTILKYFFNEIVSQQYGYFVHHINSPNQLDDHEINFIHIGEALLKLKTVSRSYQEYLTEKHLSL